MAKLIVLIKGNGTAVEFVRSYCEDFAPRALREARGIDRWVVSIVDAARSDSGFDVVSELWGDAEGCAAAHATDKFQRIGEALNFTVDEFIEKSCSPEPTGTEIKVIGCVLPIAQATKEQTRRYWDAHVPLALDVHVGLSRYVRNWVVGSSSPAAPGFFGFPMLYFPTEVDFRERYFGPGDARQRHAADIKQFVGGMVKMITAEHVVIPSNGVDRHLRRETGGT